MVIYDTLYYGCHLLLLSKESNPTVYLKRLKLYLYMSVYFHVYHKQLLIYNIVQFYQKIISGLHTDVSAFGGT